MSPSQNVWGEQDSRRRQPACRSFTDEWPTYKSVDKTYIGHRRIRHTASTSTARPNTQTVEGFFSLVTSGIRGIYHAVSSKWLQGCEALLFAASRDELAAERTRPALDAGTWVILDRWIDSPLIYQGLARGLGVDAVRSLSEFAVKAMLPDRVPVLQLAEETREARSANGPLDRMELQGDDFAAVVDRGYDQLPQINPRAVAIDANGTPEETFTNAWAAIAGLPPGQVRAASAR